MSHRHRIRCGRALGVLLSIVMATFGSLVMAMPAHAATNLGTFSYTGSSLTVSGSVGDYFGVANTRIYDIYLRNGSGSIGNYPSGTPLCSASTYVSSLCRIPSLSQAFFTINAVGTIAVFDSTDLDTLTTITVTARSSSTAAGPAAPPPPRTFGLTLDAGTGAQCTVSLLSGDEKSWITLPKASECTPSSTRPRATLLGWATSADFPVTLAKRQVDNGYAAYETTDDTGQITGLFIPAGGQTYLTWNNTLHAIWST